MTGGMFAVRERSLWMRQNRMCARYVLPMNTGVLELYEWIIL